MLGSRSHVLSVRTPPNDELNDSSLWLAFCFIIIALKGRKSDDYDVLSHIGTGCIRHGAMRSHRGDSLTAVVCV